MGQQGPYDAGILVSQSYRSHVLVAPLDHCVNPGARFIWLGFLPRPVDHRTRPVNQKGSEIRVPALTDAQQVLLAPAGVLAGHQTQPGRDLSAVIKIFSIPQGGHQSTSGNRANARNLG